MAQRKKKSATFRQIVEGEEVTVSPDGSSRGRPRKVRWALVARPVKGDPALGQIGDLGYIVTLTKLPSKRG